MSIHIVPRLGSPVPMRLINGNTRANRRIGRNRNSFFDSTAIKKMQIALAYALNLDDGIHAMSQEPRQSIAVGQHRSIASLRLCQQACKLNRQPLKMTQRAKSIELLLLGADRSLGYRP